MWERDYAMTWQSPNKPGCGRPCLAVDQTSLVASREELADPELRPERLLTSLAQIRDVVGH